MTEQLIEQIRHRADREPVPELDLDGVLRRGRRARRIRTAGHRGIATLAVGAVLGTALLVSDRSRPLDLDVSTSITAGEVDLVSSAYRTGGAFSRGDTVWFSDPEYAVDLGVTVRLMYYTANGVVAGVTNDDDGTAKREYVYVGTDGAVRELDLPGDVVPGTDAQADRLAYLTKRFGGWTVHVVEASTGRELAQRSFDAPYTWAGWDLPPIGLTGDHVVLGVDGAQRVLNWRTGERVADVPGTQLPSTGGGRALGGDLAAHTYRLGDSASLRSTEDLAVTDASGQHAWADNELSPDGRFVLTVNTTVLIGDDGDIEDVLGGADQEPVAEPVVHVTEVDTGRRITLPGHGRTYGWTPDGRLMRVDATKVTTCDGATGECVSRTVPEGPGKIAMAGRYFGS